MADSPAATAAPAAVLTEQGIRLGMTATDKWDAVRQCGAMLVELGAVAPAYADLMLERETSVSTYIGEGVAIPHGTDAARALVKRTSLAVLSFPDGVDWDGQDVRLCVAIAASGEEHVAVLSGLATVLMDPEAADRLRTADDPQVVLALLAGVADDDEESSA